MRTEEKQEQRHGAVQSAQSVESQQDDKEYADRIQLIASAVNQILAAIGEDVTRTGLTDTPQRVAKMYLETTKGLRDERPTMTVFNEQTCGECVIVRDIPLYSLCEHHLLPFIGSIDVAFRPRNNTIIGLSKVARLVEHVCSRPQVQERITSTIAQQIEQIIPVDGVFVRVRAQHMCMIMRGAKSHGSSTVTTQATGVFRSDFQLLQTVLSSLELA